MVNPVRAMPRILPAIRTIGDIEDSSTSMSLLDSLMVLVRSICVLINTEIETGKQTQAAPTDVRYRWNPLPLPGLCHRFVELQNLPAC